MTYFAQYTEIDPKTKAPNVQSRCAHKHTTVLDADHCKSDMAKTLLPRAPIYSRVVVVTASGEVLPDEDRNQLSARHFRKTPEISWTGR